MKQIGSSSIFLLGLIFVPEDGEDMLLWNVGLLTTSLSDPYLLITQMATSSSTVNRRYARVEDKRVAERKWLRVWASQMHNCCAWTGHLSQWASHHFQVGRGFHPAFWPVNTRCCSLKQRTLSENTTTHLKLISSSGICRTPFLSPILFYGVEIRAN